MITKKNQGSEDQGEEEDTKNDQEPPPSALEMNNEDDKANFDEAQISSRTNESNGQKKDDGKKEKNGKQKGAKDQANSNTNQKQNYKNLKNAQTNKSTTPPIPKDFIPTNRNAQQQPTISPSQGVGAGKVFIPTNQNNGGEQQTNIEPSSLVDHATIGMNQV